jgi:NTE family protein
MNGLANISTPKRDRRGFTAAHATARALLMAQGQQTISLISLSHRVPDPFIAQMLAETLCQVSSRSVLLVHLVLSEGHLSLSDWRTVYPGLNGEFGLAPQVKIGPGRAPSVRIQISDIADDPSGIGSLIEHCREHFHYVIFHLGVDVPAPLLTEVIEHGDTAYLLLEPSAENFYNRDLLLRELRSRAHGERIHPRTIVCRERGEEHANELLKALGPSVHGFIHGCPSFAAAQPVQQWTNKRFSADIRRLVREIARCRVGLALSSGGARSLAHIGIIQVLEENGIEVDVIAGCSMGAYVGSVWAFGSDGIEMERLAREVERRWGVLQLIDPFILPRQGFLRGEKVKRRLKSSIGDVHFSELVRPLRIVATNLNTLERTVFSSGEVATAVHASSAIPGACAPVKIDGDLYIDGGISDPLPVDVLEEMGIERIIAVNTIPTAAYLRTRFEMDREQAVRRGKQPGKFKSFINQYLNYFAPGNILDTILRSFHGAQMRVAEDSCRHADLVLRPLSCDGRWHDFRHPGKYIALGRREAEEHLDEIKALVSRKEPDSEHTITQHTMATAT